MGGATHYETANPSGSSHVISAYQRHGSRRALPREQYSVRLTNCAFSGDTLAFETVVLMRPKSRLLRVWLILGLILLAACAAWAQSPNLQTLLRSGQAALDSDDYARAATAFERARQVAPDNLQANRGLVVSYLQLGRLNEATQLGKEAAIRWPRDAQLQHWLGLAYFKAGEVPAAQAALQTSEALDGTRADIHFDLALVLLQQNQSGPAADELEKAVKLQPSLAMAHLLLGRAYQNTNRTMQAVEQFQTALRADPNAPLGHYHLAFAYASLGRNAEAIAEYEKELARSPDNPQVLYQLGHCLLETGKLEEAIGFLKKAAEIDPSNASFAYDLGKALLLAGHGDAAVAELQRAITLKPSDPSPHYQLARALEKIGKTDQAHQELQRFAELKKAQPETGGMAAGRTQ